MNKKIIFLILFLAVCGVENCLSQSICPLDGSGIKPKEINNVDHLRQLPILETGRIKPVDTYARNLLLQFSGSRTFEKTDPVRWLAKLLFASGTVQNDKVFLINNPDIAEALSIEPEEKRKYSYAQLQPSFTKLQELAMAVQKIDEKERALVENEILRLYTNISLFSDLSVTFAFAFPHPDFQISSNQTKHSINLSTGQNQFSFLDIALRADQLRKLTQPLEKKDFSKWSDDEKEIVIVVENLFQWSFQYNNLPFTIIPSFLPREEIWFSPWDAMTRGLHDEQGREEIDALRNMVVAYWNGQQIDFDLAVKGLASSIKKRVDGKNLKAMSRLNLEIFYNKTPLLVVSKILYFLTFLIFFITLGFKTQFLYKAGVGMTLLAFLITLIVIIIRIMILQRPPVSNLYETFIFVGFISVGAGLLIEKINKNWIGLVISGISGFVFLSIAGKFAMEGDTLKMLVAVLNSNFWLSTHVISITIGYAGVCVAGIVGHIYLLQSVFKPNDKKLLDSTFKILIGTLGFGLTMTFLGTNLGGIWADQSWGRFWGWDPKENGALLIVLWTAILFHAKIARLIGPLGFAVGSILAIIVVMWAWFGVNLLSVGLHSYGFTSGLGTKLLVYVLVQLAFILLIVPLAIRKMR